MPRAQQRSPRPAPPAAPGRLGDLVSDLPPWARLLGYAVGVTGGLMLEAVEGPAALALIGLRLAAELNGGRDHGGHAPHCTCQPRR